MGVASYGQVYHPLVRTNTFWDILQGDGSQICSLSGGNQYFFQGDDTLIMGQTYQIIRGYPIVNVNPGPYCPPFAVDGSVSTIWAFMREDTTAKKVFVFDQGNNSDALLYDFTLIAGDTLNSYYAGLGQTLVVDSVGDTVLLDGAIRKIVYLNNGEFYIESIGSSQGLCSPIILGTGVWGIHACVSENDIQLWGTQCYGYLGVSEMFADSAFSVFPNPTQNFLQIERNGRSNGILKIMDLTGRLVFVEEISESTKNIDISQLASDTYIYSFESENSVKITGKFVVIR